MNFFDVVELLEWQKTPLPSPDRGGGRGRETMGRPNGLKIIKKLNQKIREKRFSYNFEIKNVPLRHIHFIILSERQRVGA